MLGRKEEDGDGEAHNAAAHSGGERRVIGVTGGDGGTAQAAEREQRKTNDGEEEEQTDQTQFHQRFQIRVVRDYELQVHTRRQILMQVLGEVVESNAKDRVIPEDEPRGRPQLQANVARLDIALVRLQKAVERRGRQQEGSADQGGDDQEGDHAAAPVVHVPQRHAHQSEHASARCRQHKGHQRNEQAEHGSQPLPTALGVTDGAQHDGQHQQGGCAEDVGIARHKSGTVADTIGAHVAHPLANEVERDDADRGGDGDNRRLQTLAGIYQDHHGDEEDELREEDADQVHEIKRLCRGQVADDRQANVECEGLGLRRGKEARHLAALRQVGDGVQKTGGADELLHRQRANGHAEKAVFHKWQ